MTTDKLEDTVIEEIIEEEESIKIPLSLEEIRYQLSCIVPGLYPDWRKNQLELIEQVKNSSAKFIGIQAPVGFGKSSSAIGDLILEDGRGIAITQTKQLGDQYYRDFYPVGLLTVKGRGNFSCQVQPNKTADVAPCVAGMSCIYKQGGCEYYDQKNAAKDTHVISMNIHYFLYEANFSGVFSNIDTLFIDEAHKLDGPLMEFIEVRLNKIRLKEEGIFLPDNHSIESLQTWADEPLSQLTQEYEEVLQSLKENPQNEIATLRGIRIKAILNSLEKLVELVDSTWVVIEEEFNTIIKPTLVAKYMDKFIFSHAKKIVLMSGTLPRSVIESFGINKYEYFKLESTFDVTKRPVIWIPAANLARSAENPAMEQAKLIKVLDVLSERHKDSKGIIHTANYNLAKIITSKLKDFTRVITHTSAEDRISALKEFTEDKSNTILVSPSFTEGIDLPYDLCRWQVIAKIPYANLGDTQVKARNEIEPQWYATNAIVSMIQAYGRIMRAEDDSGVTYITDSGLINLINRWRTVFDNISYFLEALFISEGNKLIPYFEYQMRPKK